MSEEKKLNSCFRVYFYSQDKRTVGPWLHLHRQSKKSKFKGGALELLLNVLSKGSTLKFESNYKGRAGIEALVLEDESIHNITIHNSAPDYIRIFAYQLIFCAWQTRSSILLKDIPVSFTSRSLKLNGRLSDMYDWEYENSQTSIVNKYFLGNSPYEWIANPVKDWVGCYSYFKKESAYQDKKIDFLENLFLKCLMSKKKVIQEFSDLNLFPVNILGSNISNWSIQEIASKRLTNLSNEFDESVDVISLLTLPYYQRKVKLSDRLKEMLGNDQNDLKEKQIIDFEEQKTGYCNSCENDPCICSDPRNSSIEGINILN